jgi:alkylhydroperoxidase family enzyme
VSADPVLEAVRATAREAVAASSLRLVASEVGISHPQLSRFTAEGSVQTPHGTSRRKLLAWAEAQARSTAGADSSSAIKAARAEGFRHAVLLLTTMFNGSVRELLEGKSGVS